MMQEPQEVVEETVTIEEDPGTPSSHVSVVTSDDGTTRRTETKVLLLTSATFSCLLFVLIMMLFVNCICKWTQVLIHAHNISWWCNLMNYNKETQWKSPSKRRAVLYKKSACLISEVTEYFHALQKILNYIKKKYINILLVDIFT